MFDLTNIASLEESTTEKTTRLQGIFDRGGITPNQLSQTLNLGKVEGPHADKYFMQSSYIPVDDIVGSGFDE